MNKVTILPLASDICTLSRYLAQIVEQSMTKLNSGDDSASCHSSFVLLTEASLAQIVMFNRGRAGEVSKMKISTYNEAVNMSNATPSDVQLHLSPVEKQLRSVLTRVEISGKRGRTVPVLLTSQFKEAVDCILARRSSFDVWNQNE